MINFKSQINWRHYAWVGVISRRTMHYYSSVSHRSFDVRYSARAAQIDNSISKQPKTRNYEIHRK